MKKSLNNAMMKKFETMVAGADDQTDSTVSAPEPVVNKKTSASAQAAPKAPVAPVVETTVTQATPVAPAVSAAPAAVVINDPVPVVDPVPAVPVTPVPVPEPEEQAPTSRERKIIPLTPDEKSSGVLHIRLGELRSYVDFITQFNKTSYQQYISSLIEQDYEQHKDTYLKYREFMEQFHM